jgi:hypothetical protein
MEISGRIDQVVIDGNIVKLEHPINVPISEDVAPMLHGELGKILNGGIKFENWKVHDLEVSVDIEVWLEILGHKYDHTFHISEGLARDEWVKVAEESIGIASVEIDLKLTSDGHLCARMKACAGFWPIGHACIGPSVCIAV